MPHKSISEVKTQPPTSRTIFVTGTDTGAGKTVLTALLLTALRLKGHHALALKPFATGDRADPLLLNSLQDEELSMSEVNPFFFRTPAAPLLAARLEGRRISLAKAQWAVQSQQPRCDILLVEGVGGVLVPLGPGYSVLDWMRSLDGDLLIAARNRLGTINHTLLTWKASLGMGRRRLAIVLMDSQERSIATRANARILREFCRPSPVFSLPFLGENAFTLEGVKKNAKKLRRILARIVAVSNVFVPARKEGEGKVTGGETQGKKSGKGV